MGITVWVGKVVYFLRIPPGGWTDGSKPQAMAGNRDSLSLRPER